MKCAWGIMVGVGLAVLAPAAFAEIGTAVIQPTGEGSAVSGKATLTDTPSGLAVSVEVKGVAPGKHGLHIHQFGSCDQAGVAAGGHFNPASAPHGFLPSDGIAKAHAGDFGNIEVKEDGAGVLTLVLLDLSLGGGRYSIGGRAVVLHEKVDDFGQPTGNAGGRIGCGTIVIAGE